MTPGTTEFGMTTAWMRAQQLGAPHSYWAVPCLTAGTISVRICSGFPLSPGR
jgi:hypothetical protein